jgi:hypothetical protein
MHNQIRDNFEEFIRDKIKQNGFIQKIEEDNVTTYLFKEFVFKKEKLHKDKKCTISASSEINALEPLEEEYCVFLKYPMGADLGKEIFNILFLKEEFQEKK